MKSNSIPSGNLKRNRNKVHVASQSNALSVKPQLSQNFVIKNRTRPKSQKILQVFDSLNCQHSTGENLKWNRKQKRTQRLSKNLFPFHSPKIFLCDHFTAGQISVFNYQAVFAHISLYSLSSTFVNQNSPFHISY